MRLGLLCALLVAAGVPALVRAQQPPVFHGTLSVVGGSGKLDTNVGTGMLKVQKWVFNQSRDSNGMAPDTEPIVIGIGETNRLVIPAGQLRPSRNGKRFTYRNAGSTQGVRSFEMRRLKDAPDGTVRYRVALTLVGVDLSRLVVESPTCTPLAVVVGDDDGFSGVDLERPGILRGGTRLRVLGGCNDVGEWPWL